MNISLTVQCDAEDVEQALLDEHPADAPTFLANFIEDASDIAGRFMGEVLVTINVHEADDDQEGFPTGHASVTVSRVDPAAAAQREKEAKARAEAHERTDGDDQPDGTGGL